MNVNPLLQKAGQVCNKAKALGSKGAGGSREKRSTALRARQAGALRVTGHLHAVVVAQGSDGASAMCK
jgi:hypothetical protein